MVSQPPVAFTATRDQLIEALTYLEAYPASAGPGQRVFINAESMADAIITALESVPKTVHFMWPPPCGGFTVGDLWSGNIDRVNCEPCRTAAEEG